MESSAKAQRIRIGISMCLLGEQVRYDGGHKRDPFITQTLGRYFDWQPVCPEVELGLGIPRESIRLVQRDGAIQLVGIKSDTDHTVAMRKYSEGKVNEIAKWDLRGFILKKDSPSCGMERVKVHASSGAPRKDGMGFFAKVLMERFPLLPVEEEGRLQDPALRENFIERIFCYHRWLEFRHSARRPKNFVEFHTRHKLTLLSHDRDLYTQMGRIVADGKSAAIDEYGKLFMRCLKHHATRKKHSNVLYHLLGYLKKAIDPDDKTELVACIENYRNELVPLIVPITLLLHHFRRNPIDWVLQQTYLNPYPAELMLRNV